MSFCGMLRNIALYSPQDKINCLEDFIFLVCFRQQPNEFDFGIRLYFLNETIFVLSQLSKYTLIDIFQL